MGLGTRFVILFILGIFVLLIGIFIWLDNPLDVLGAIIPGLSNEEIVVKWDEEVEVTDPDGIEFEITGVKANIFVRYVSEGFEGRFEGWEWKKRDSLFQRYFSVNIKRGSPSHDHLLNDLEKDKNNYEFVRSLRDKGFEEGLIEIIKRVKGNKEGNWRDNVFLKIKIDGNDVLEPYDLNDDELDELDNFIEVLNQIKKGLEREKLKER